ncbi:SPFH domain-containing protein [Streptomyces antibioticus]|uniref:SPFH domain-containing protein n=1 Tax=Streptomyces antibioticus TaxID=1890 RepID=A0AAE7CKM5_STRAT|nr:SPFH domain-containing protein [Streptomyces antibioticus]QIT44720.1 SPFH domain-containing protein [Streptomyces antibioticus]
MSTTTTSHTPEPEGTANPPAEEPTPTAPPLGAAEFAAPRPTPRLIQNEATTEIPVHLLFRDEAEPRTAAMGPAVVGSRAGTGEQPRLRRPGPMRPRPAAEVDPALVERRARVLPGAVGVLAGACGAAGCLATSWWAGVLPPLVSDALRLPVLAGTGLGPAQWAAYAGAGALGMFGFGGLARGRTGRAWVLGLFGRYRGTVRRTGLLWVNPLLLRRRVDVRLRHWRSEPMAAADGSGVALRVVVLVVWRVRDTARATLGVEDHETYLRECVEAALARIPVEAPGSGRGSVDAAGEALTRRVAREAGAIGLEVYSVQPLRVEYAPEVAAAMHRRRIAALDAQHRATVLTSVVDSVEDTVTRLTMRGLVELDDYERKALVKDLTVAFCSARGEQAP